MGRKKKKKTGKGKKGKVKEKTQREGFARANLQVSCLVQGFGLKVLSKIIVYKTEWARSTCQVEPKRQRTVFFTATFNKIKFSSEPK